MEMRPVQSRKSSFMMPLEGAIFHSCLYMLFFFQDVSTTLSVAQHSQGIFFAEGKFTILEWAP